MKKQFITLFALALICASASFIPIETKAMYFEEGDRYRPSTCTIVDEEGSLEIAICTKKVVDGPCIKEVKCEQPIPQ